MHMLGNSLAKIAGEKAGIIKKNIPVVIGERHPETDAVFTDYADRMQAPLIFAEDKIRIGRATRIADQWELDLKLIESAQTVPLILGHPAEYQLKNLITLCAGIGQIEKKFQLDWSDMRSGLANFVHATGFMGRFTILGKKPLIILDSGHNRNGIEASMKELQRYSYDDLHLVMGMVKDKDSGPLLKQFPTNAHYYFCRANIPRGMDAPRIEDVCC